MLTRQILKKIRLRAAIHLIKLELDMCGSTAKGIVLLTNFINEMDVGIIEF